MKNVLRVAVVIPCYNEERHIANCLHAIAAQSVLPDEVIVVDNNCSDATVAIARAFPFVTIIHEPNQGKGYARNAGFDSVTADIIGRIDADSSMDMHWVRNVKAYFKQHEEVAAIAGIGRTSILPILNWPTSTIMSRAYYWYAHSVFGAVTMWGASSAIRRRAWEVVRDDVCLDDTQVHEDQDLSLCLIGKNMQIDQVNSVRITTNGQTFRYLPKLLHYNNLQNKTKALHCALGNLPAPVALRIHYLDRIVSYLFALPFGLYITVVASLLVFPLDWFMLNVIKSKTWFD